MIANLITRQREKEDAEEIFCKAKKHNEGIKPEYVVTDGLQSYRDGFNEVFYDHHHSCTYVRADGLRARTNNNKVERLHNTLRERFKTMRGLQNENTTATFNDGFRAFYNHIRENLMLCNFFCCYPPIHQPHFHQNFFRLPTDFSPEPGHPTVITKEK